MKKREGKFSKGEKCCKMNVNVWSRGMGDMNIDLIFKLRHTYDGRTDKYHCSFFAIILGKTQKMFPIEGKYYSIYNFVSCQ